MRQRSKSMFIEKGSKKDMSTSEDNDWLLEDKLKLILQIKDLLPNKDSLPFDQRVQNIEWTKIGVGSYSSSEIKEMFSIILKNTRTFRILTEVLKDAEKDLLSSLDIKKPISAFALFIQQNKDEITLENSKINGGYTQTAANIFKSLPDEEREQYVFKSQKAKQDYEEELSKLQKNNPSKPSSASPFYFFLDEVKRSDKTANYHNTRKLYYEMEPKKKLKLILKFLGVTHGNMLTLEQFEKAVAYLSKDEMSLIDDYEKRPKKMNAFNIFMSKQLKGIHKGPDRTNMFKSCIDSWKNLSETEKLTLKKYSNELKTQYEKDFDTFLESLPDDRRLYEKNKNKKNFTKKILTENESEINIEVKDKKKRSRKLPVSIKQEDITMEEPKKKSRKLSQELNSIKNNLVVSEKTNGNKLNFKLVKPPGSLYKYFALQVYKGSKEESKSAFKALDNSQHEKLTKQYEKSKKKYLKEFEKYLGSLSADEISLFARQINESGNDDNISDITDSD